MFDKNLITLIILGIYCVTVAFYDGFLKIHFCTYLATLLGYILLKLNNLTHFLLDLDTTKNFFLNMCTLFYFTLFFNLIKLTCNFIFYIGFIETITACIIVYSFLSATNVVSLSYNIWTKFLHSIFKPISELCINYCKVLISRLNDIYQFFNTPDRIKSVDLLKNNLTLSAVNRFMPIPTMSDFNISDFDKLNIDSQLDNLTCKLPNIYNQSYKNKLNNNNIMEFLKQESIASVIDDLSDSDDSDSEKPQIKQVETIETSKPNKLPEPKSSKQLLRDKINQKKNVRTGNNVKNISKAAGDLDLGDLMNNSNMNAIMQNAMNDPNFQNIMQQMTGGSGKIDKKKLEKLMQQS